MIRRFPASSAMLYAACSISLGLTACPTEALDANDDGDGTGGGINLTGTDGDTSPDPSPGATTSTGGPGEDAGVEDETAGGTEDAGAGSQGESGSSCPGEENACGGCEALSQTVGEACNDCEELSWQCAGPNTVECTGTDPNADEYWPDADEDGFGDQTQSPVETCAPAAGWVNVGGDCNDDNDEIHPDATEVCNSVDDDCDDVTDEGPNPLCDDVCCSFEMACNGEECAPKCDVGEICGADLDTCCAENEICFANECVVPGSSCEFTEECAIDEVCSQASGECVPEEVVPVCEFIPPVGEFDPVLGCRWTTDGLAVDVNRGDVVATPAVLNLTEDDVPDIAFITYDRNGDGCCNTEGTLRVVHGACNEDGTMTTLASLNESDIETFSPGSGYYINNDTGLAIADITGNGVPEIVTVTKSTSNNNNVRGTVAFSRTADDGTAWEVLWLNEDYPNWDVHTRGGAVVSLADLDADGTAEVVIGNVVLNGEDGTLAWDGVVTAAAGGFTGGTGNNGFLGPSSAVADIDLDGRMEVVAGNTVYEDDGTVKWEYTYTTQNSSCGAGGGLTCDGFNAVANFDEDNEGEVVIVRQGEVFVLDDDGSELHRAALPIIDCSFNESGPPTVADFDGDGEPEIGTASADYMVVVDWGCTGDPLPEQCASENILWQVTNNDCSSRVTASSVFDFEGDGVAEVVYADETSVKIFDGRDGTILYEDTTHGSHTRIEMPVIADVDNDGNAEIIIPENVSNGGNPGIDVWEDASDNWVRTRRVWNQHGYHITHINEDGTIPTVPEINWLNERFNNYRQNVQPDGLFHAPDAVLDGILCDIAAAVSNGDNMELSVLVRNDGALRVPAGTAVRVELDDEGTIYPLSDTVTSIDLQPGQFEVIAVSTPIPDGVAPPFTVRAIVDPGNETNENGAMNECNEDNNTLEALCNVPG